MTLENHHALEIASKKYRIEKTMQGSVIVWGVPVNFVSKVEDDIRETMKTENKFAKATLAANKIPFEASKAVYTVTSDSKGTADTVNIRFRVGYNGPEIPDKLKSKIHKGQALTDWMQAKVSSSVDKVVQLESKVLADQIEVKTDFAIIKGRIYPSAMVFLVTPTYPTYLPLISKFMPAKISGIDVVKHAETESKGFLAYRTEAAGKAYLIKVGKVVDTIIETVMKQSV